MSNWKSININANQIKAETARAVRIGRHEFYDYNF